MVRGALRPQPVGTAICDLVTNPDQLLAITCLLELRLLALKNNIESLDPHSSSSLSAEELVQLADSNDAAVARSSLNAELRHWQDGRAINCKDWLRELIDQLTPWPNRSSSAPA